MVTPVETDSLAQPPPKVNAELPLWPQVMEDVLKMGGSCLVIADMQERDQLGQGRYGTALQPFNGRDALKDAYAEALDLAVYLKQEMVERARWLRNVYERLLRPEVDREQAVREDLTHIALHGRYVATLDTIYILRKLLLERDAR